jgi:hypothetical protein
MLNARYAVVPVAPPPDWPVPDRAGEAWPTVYEDDQVRVLERPSALPRAWIVHEARQVGPGDALAPFASKEADPRQVALLETPPPPTSEPVDSDADTATITRYSPDEITIQATTDAPGLLVLSETWDAGWQATVNGAEATVYRANHTLRAVAIPAGTSTIEMRYAPSSLTIGLGITLAGLVGLTVALLGGIPLTLRPRRFGPSPDRLGAARSRALHLVTVARTGRGRWTIGTGVQHR